MEKYPHKFIAGSENANYPYACSKCGLGINKYSMPVLDCNKKVTKEIPSCPYPDPITTIINQK